MLCGVMQTERIAINDRNACTGLISNFLSGRQSLRITLVEDDAPLLYGPYIITIALKSMVLLIGVNEHGKRVREKK